MTKQQILELEDKAITLEQLNEIEESPLVESVECCGNSGVYPHLLWYVITFKDGLQMDVYF